MSGLLDPVPPTTNKHLPISHEHEGAGLQARVVELERELAEQRWMTAAIQAMAFGSAAVTGHEFLQALLRQLCTTLKVRYAFVTEWVQGRTDRIRVVAGWCGDHKADSIEYDLFNTPCQKVLLDGEAFFPHGVRQLFPQDEYLTELNIESYMGVPLMSGGGPPAGHLCIMDVRPFLFERSQGSTIMRIFAERATAELERFRAEKALRQQEERFRTLYDDNPSMYFTLSPDGTVISVNQFGAAQLGYTADQLTGQSVIAVFDPGDHQTVLTQLHQCTRKPHQTFEWEIQKIRRNGTRLWVHERARTIAGTEGALTILIVCEDVTEHRKTTQLLSTLVRESPLPIVSLDPDARITSWNPAATRLFGWTENEVLGRELPYIQAGEEAAADALWQAGIRGEVGGPIELRRQRKDGAMLDLLLWPVFVHEEPDKPAIAIGFYVDQSDLKRTEEAWIKSETRLNFLLAHSPAMLYTASASGNFDATFVSGNITNRLGYEPHEFTSVPRFWIDRIHPDDAPGTLANLSRLFEQNCLTHEYRFLNKQGEYRWIHDELVLIRGSEGHPIEILGSWFDITERKQAEASLADHVHQQAIVAALGQLALAGADLQRLFDQAVGMVATTFKVEYCEVLERSPDGGRLKLVAGVGWKEGLVGHAVVSAGRNSQAGFTMLTKEPVIVEDLRSETRFSGPSLLHDHGVVSGISVIIGSVEQPFGVFGAHTTGRRTFSQDDAHFFHAVANVLGEGIQRKRTEEALRASEEQFRQIAESIEEVVWSADPSIGRILYVSQAYERIWGRSCVSLYAQPKSFLDAIHPDDRPRVLSDLAVQRDGLPFAHEYRVVRPDGEIRWLWDRGFPIADRKTGTVTHYVGVALDITDRKRSEEALRTSEAYLHRFVADAPVGLVILGEDKRVICANKALCELTGYTEQEILGNTYELYTHPEDLPANLILTDEFYRGVRSEYTYEKRYIRKSGEIIWVSIKATRVELPGRPGPLLLAAVQDITERELAAEERELLSRDLHDNILQSLYAVGMQLEAGKMAMGKSRKRSKTHMTHAIDHLNHLMLEVRQYITLLTQRTAPKPDFGQALRLLVASLSATWQAAPKLQIQDPVLSLVSSTQGEQLLNIAREALSNSMRHAAATRRSVRLSRTRGTIRLEIRDNGVGFPLSRRRLRGHGLTNMAARAKNIHARLTVTSAPGKGTRVTVEVPVEKGTANA